MHKHNIAVIGGRGGKPEFKLVPKTGKDKVKMSSNLNKNLPMLECKRCGHRWRPRGPGKPRVCPRCKTKYWEFPKEKTFGEIAKMVGMSRTYLYYLNYLKEHKDLISDLFPKVLSGEVKIYKAYRELRRREAVLAV